MDIEQNLPKEYVMLSYVVNDVTKESESVYLNFINEFLDTMIYLSNEFDLPNDKLIGLSFDKVLNGQSHNINKPSNKLKYYLHDLVTSSFIGCENKPKTINQLKVFFNTKFNSNLIKTKSELNFFIELYLVFNETIFI